MRHAVEWVHMVQQDIERTIDRIAKKIVKELHPEKVILFGSWAWGTPGPDSDVDLLIVKKREGEFLEEHRRVRRIINGEIAADILIYTPEEVERRSALGDFFIKGIIAKGTYLYG